MTEERFRELRELRNKYFSLLGDTFHHNSATDLARTSLNPNYRDFVEDYVSICLPEFRKKYEKVKQSQLESSAQTSPKCTESTPIRRIDAMEPGYSELGD